MTTGPNFLKTRAALRFTINPTAGGVFFVSSLTGSATGGYTADAPSLTLAQALALCTADAGDVIYLLPGHVEAVAAAAYLTASKAGVTVIGLGNGTDRATFTWGTSTAAQIIVSGANLTFQNIRCDFTGIDAVVAGISVTGADVAFDSCEFITNSATAGCVLGILTAATATRFRFTNNRCLGPATNTGTTTTAVIQHEVGVDYLIKGNYFTGKMTQAILNTTNTVLRGLISDNDFVIATGTLAVSMKSTSTPFITKNRINVPSGTAPIVAAAGFVAGNVYSAAVGVTAGAASTF